MPVTEKSKVQSRLPADSQSDVDRIRSAIERREEKIRNLAIGYRKDRLAGRFSAEQIAEGLYTAILEKHELPSGKEHEDWTSMVDEYLRKNPVDPESVPNLTLNTPLKPRK